jgi:hypothetical protein
MKRTGPSLASAVHYSTLSAKNVRSVLQQELLTNFGFEHMFLVADLLVERFLAILQECHVLEGATEPFQTVVFGYDRYHQFEYMRRPWQVHLKAARVSLISGDELARLTQGTASLRDLTAEMAVRILKEAYGQGAILSFVDVGLLLHLTPASVARSVRHYKETHPDDFVPHCGTVLDMGPTVTHKRPAILAYLQSHNTAEAARLIHHDPGAVDRYINDYERVRELARESKNVPQICFLTKLSKHVVQQYLALWQEFEGGSSALSPQESDAPATKDITH